MKQKIVARYGRVQEDGEFKANLPYRVIFEVSLVDTVRTCLKTK